VNRYVATAENITLAKLLNVSVKRATQNVVDISETITVYMRYSLLQHMCGYIEGEDEIHKRSKGKTGNEYLGKYSHIFLTKLAAVTSENRLKRDRPTVSYMKHYNAH
jgi:hypothetical protein